MEISVKRLGQPAKSITVSESTTVRDLLPKISSECDVEIERISLIFKGTPLSGKALIVTYSKDKGHTLKDYSIQTGDRIMVVVKPPICNNFETLLLKYLQKSHDQAEAKAISEKFMRNLTTTLNSLSMDDIDRLAAVFNK